MHVLTIAGQNPQPDDFNWATSGEIAFPGFVCCRATSCGCNRSWIGASSLRGATVLVVADLEVTREELIDTCRQALEGPSGFNIPTQTYPSLVDTNLDAAIVFNPGVRVRPVFGGIKWGFATVD